VVDWGLVGGDLALALEFLVEAEHGSLLLAVEVTCAATPGCEVGVWWWWADCCLGCWPAGIGTGCEAVCMSYIAGTASSRVEVVRCWDGGVWLGDFVCGGHFD
jgi:hypothetical protein